MRKVSTEIQSAEEREKDEDDDDDDQVIRTHLAQTQRTNAYLRGVNDHFMAGVDGRLQLAQQHRLQATRELELQQSALQEERHVVGAVSALSNGQHDESLGRPCPSPEHHVHGQGMFQFITTSFAVSWSCVDPMTHIRVASERRSSYLKLFLAKHSPAVVGAQTLQKEGLRMGGFELKFIVK